MKTEILKACIFILIGAYLCTRFYPSKPEIITKVEVREVEKKSGRVERKIVRQADGSERIDEVETYLSDRSHESVRIDIPTKKKNIWSIIPKYSFQDQRSSLAASYSYNGLGLFISSDKQVGVVFQFSY